VTAGCCSDWWMWAWFEPDTCTVALLMISKAVLQIVHSLTTRSVWRVHGYLSASDEV
jgi:hypothetical protein